MSHENATKVSWINFLANILFTFDPDLKSFRYFTLMMDLIQEGVKVLLTSTVPLISPVTIQSSISGVNINVPTSLVKKN